MVQRDPESEEDFEELSEVEKEDSGLDEDSELDEDQDYEDEKEEQPSRKTPEPTEPSIWQISSKDLGEALLRVFEFVCLNEEMLPEEFFDEPIPERPYVVALVCKYWASLAISHRILWRHIDFSDPRRAHVSLMRITPRTPLRIVLADPHRGPCAPFGLRGKKATGWEKYVRPRIGQIESLFIHVGNPEDFTGKETRWLVETPPPAGVLRDLRLEAAQTYDHDWLSKEELDEMLENDYFSAERLKALEDIARIPSLGGITRLTLVACELPLWSAAYDNLTELNLASFIPLLKWRDTMKLLFRSPLLQVLKLSLIYEDEIPDDADSIPAISLSYLRRLKLSSRTNRPTEWLMSHIITPALEHLDLLIRSDNDKREKDVLGGEFYRLLDPLVECPLTRRIHRVEIFSYYEGTHVELIGHYRTEFDEIDDMSKPSDCDSNDHPDFDRHGLQVRVHGATWEDHKKYPSGFLAKFPNITHLENCGIGNEGLVQWLLRGASISIFRMYTNMEDPFGVLELLGVPGSLSPVRIMELGLGFWKNDPKYFVDALKDAHSLRIVRLFNYNGLTSDSIATWMQYGIRNRVQIQWLQIADDLSVMRVREGVRPRIVKPTWNAAEIIRKREERYPMIWKNPPPSAWEEQWQKDARYVPRKTVSKRVILDDERKSKMLKTQNPKPKLVLRKDLDFNFARQAELLARDIRIMETH